MRRIVFEDETLDVKISVDMPEELFQGLKEAFGAEKLRLYIGTMAQNCLKAAIVPLMFGEKEEEE